jgi:hypothetical protein
MASMVNQLAKGFTVIATCPSLALRASITPQNENKILVSLYGATSLLEGCN